MKHIAINISLILLVLFAGFVSCSSSKNSISDTDPAITGQALDSGNWIFTVTTVLPQAGRARQPNGIYTVSYTATELNVNLPYFGRAYSGADVLSGQNPLSFISKNFQLQKQRTKDDKWRLVFKFPDQPQLQSMTIEIFDSGTANLDIILTNRSPMSYRGNLQVKKII